MGMSRRRSKCWPMKSLGKQKIHAASIDTIFFVRALLKSGRALGWEWTTLDQVPGPLDHPPAAGWSRPKVHGIA